MIKPSHFELKAEGQSWKTEGMFQQHSSDSFNPSNMESNLPVAPMVSVTPPAVKDRDSKVISLSDPISSTGAIKPSITSSESGISPAFPRPQVFHPFYKRSSTSEVYTFQEVTLTVYGNQWKGYFRVALC